MTTKVGTLAALDSEAAAFARALSPRPQEATLVTLSGELGAGKTAFVKGVAKTLGVADIVNSPTFVLEKIYALPVGGAFSRLIHIDAYRLQSGAELVHLGFEELLKDGGNLILLEWPERVHEALPSPAASISITHEDGARVISYER